MSILGEGSGHVSAQQFIVNAKQGRTLNNSWLAAVSTEPMRLAECACAGCVSCAGDEAHKHECLGMT